MNRSRNVLESCVLAALVLAASRLPVHATSVRPMNLEDLTRRAGRIFSGRCVHVQSVTDSALHRPVTVATFEVDRAVKGVSGHRVTIRVLGASERGGTTDFGGTSFAVGEEVVLFLYEDSELGLTSPVGLGQGKLPVGRDKRGERLVVAPFAAHLYRDLGTETRRALGRSARVAGPSESVALDRLLDAADGIVRLGSIERRDGQRGGN